MGDVIAVNTGATVTGTSDNDLFQILGAPFLLDGSAGYDIASIGVNVTFAANSLVGIEQYNIIGGIKVSFAALTTAVYVAPLVGSTKGYTLTGSLGNDTLYGSNQADLIDGLQGNDTLRGGAGNDTLTGGPGNDLIMGEEGDDFIQVKRGTGGDTIDGGVGIDRLSLDVATRSENMTLDISDSSVIQYLGEGSVISGIEQMTVTGGLGADRFTGGALADQLNGGDGDDVLKGNGGNDRIDGGNGYDVAVFSGKEADYTVTALGGGQYQVTSAAEGTDVLTGIETMRFVDGDRPVGGYVPGAAYWGSPNGSGTMTFAAKIPDGRGANPGTGFTITGMVRLSDGTFWAANEGQADAFDTTYTPSLMRIAADGTTKLAEFNLPGTVRAVQGLAVDESTGRIFYASLSERMIRVINATGAQIGSFAMPTGLAPNALTYDAITNQLVVGLSKGSANNTVVQWMSATTGAVTKTLNVGVNPDHLFIQTDKGAQGTLYVSYGEAPGTGYIAEFDVQTGTRTGVFALPQADAIEGISISGSTVWLANDAYYHNGNPAENRILAFDLVDNATQLVRSNTTTGLTIDLGLRDQTLADGTRLVGVNRLFFAGGEASDSVIGGRFDDVLVGNGGDDSLSGLGGQDRLVGGTGNDVLTGGAGNDGLEGNGGTDTAVFSGKVSEYSFTMLSDIGVQVTDLIAGRDGSDLASYVEFFRFQDAVYSFAELFSPPLPLGSVQLSATITDENAVAGTVIGSVSIDNPEGVPITYSLVSDQGGRFALNGADLVAGTTAIDFEQGQTYVVTIRATDTQHNRIVDTQFTITANDLDEAPTDIVASNVVSISELTLFQVKIADLKVLDPDLAPAFNTHQLAVSDDRFFIDGDALYLKAGQTLSHASEPTIDLVLTVTDDPALLSKHLLVTVDQAAVPTEVTLSGATVRENLAAGTVIGNLGLPGAAGLVQFEIIGDPSGSFALDGNKLVTTASLDFEAAASRFVTVRGTDQAGRVVEQVLTVGVLDANDAATGLAAINQGYLPDHTVLATKVADLTFSDADTNAAFRSYSWQVSDSRFEVIGSSLYLKAGQVVDGVPGAPIPVIVTLNDGEFTSSITLNIDVKGGTEGDDKGLYAVFGTNTGDVLNGLGGHDEIYGYAGNDTINGGAGDDTIDGGAGADTVDGGTGIDTMSYASALAGVRVDMLTPSFSTGDAQGDLLTNIENIRGSAYADRIQGNNAANTISGGQGADNIAGGGGVDKLFGNEGNDTISGQGGTDLIDGGAGDDMLSGGSSGADTFVFAGGWGNDVITDYEANLDILDFKTNGISISDLTVTQVGADTWIYGPSGESLRLLNTLKDKIILQAAPPAVGPVLGLTLSASTIAENSAAGSVVGALQPSTTGTTSGFTYTLLDDAAGRFTIAGGNLVATGAAMNYELTTAYLIKIRLTDDAGKFVDKSFNIGLTDVNDAPSAVTIANQVAITENTAVQTKVADIVVTDEDTNPAFRAYTYTLSDDRFTMIGASVFLKAGQVVDYETAATIPLTVTVGDGSVNVVKQIVLDVIDVNEAAGPLTFTGTGDADVITTDADIIFGKRGDDLITATNRYKAIISGGEGNDLIRYTSTDGIGFAVVHGDDQNDTIYGGAGADQLYGDAGEDLVDGDVGDDLVDGGDGSDVLYGGIGNDTIVGGTGSDTIFGGLGNDRITGGTGEDILSGGAGADAFDGGMGNDTASYADALAAVRAELKTPGNNQGDARGDTYVDIENLLGSSFDDGLSGNDNSNWIWGGDGNDTINGLGGTDNLVGGAGNDRISGQGGNDVLNGGDGNDILSGGTSSIDLFVFDRFSPSGTLTGWGNDTITDFEHGADRIRVTGGIGFADLQVSQVGANTVIVDPTTGATITLNGISASVIDATDFLF